MTPDADGHYQPVEVTTDVRSDQGHQVLRSLVAELDLDWASPLRSLRLMWTGAGAVKVDDGAGPAELRRMVQDLRGLGPAELVQLPIALTGGAIPTAQLLSSATQVLQGFETGDPVAGCGAGLLD